MQVRYPVFQPPFPFAQRDPRSWSRAEAEAFLVWFTATLEGRVAQFSSYIREPLRGDAAHTLVKMGYKLLDLLGNTQFSYEVKEVPKTAQTGIVTPVTTKRRLTDEGLAQAIDASLLTAKFLLSDCANQLEWSVATGRLRRKGTDFYEVGFHHPSLVGFPGFARFKPLAIAAEVAIKVLTGELAPEAWALVYSQFRRYSSIELMIGGMADASLEESERGRLACELARANDERSFPALISLLSTDIPHWALRALEELRDPRSAEAIEDFLLHPDALTRTAARAAMSALKRPRKASCSLAPARLVT